LVLACLVSVADTVESSLDGARIVTASFRTGDLELFAVDLGTGDAVNLSRSPGSIERYPSVSPDGRTIAFNSDRDGTHNLFLMDADGSNLRQLTHEKEPVVAGMQSWTADGGWIYFGLFGGGPPRVCRIRPDSTGFEVVLSGGIDPAVSPDGRTIVYAKEGEGGHRLYRCDADGSNEVQISKSANRFAGVHATWSPDGRWIVYADRDGEGLELFRCNRDGDEVGQLTRFGANRPSTSPSVSPDGRWITFRLCDEIYWANAERMKLAYSERRGDKRPVWVMTIDGDAPRVLEPLRYQTTIDGSRAPWLAGPSGSRATETRASTIGPETPAP